MEHYLTGGFVIFARWKIFPGQLKANKLFYAGAAARGSMPDCLRTLKDILEKFPCGSPGWRTCAGWPQKRKKDWQNCFHLVMIVL
jgi:hypothetical protein